MKKIGVGREHRAQNGGFLTQDPELTIFVTLMIILFFLAILKAENHILFQLSFIGTSIYNVTIILAAAFGAIALDKRFKSRWIVIGLTLVFVFVFVFFGEVIGEFLLLSWAT
jgi:hypothetical protein